MSKPLLILDQHFRTVSELFDDETYRALGDICEIVGGENRPMDRAKLLKHLPDASFLVAARPDLTGEEVAAATHLRAIMEVSGAFHEGLDYDACFAHGIEVLSCAPGFRFAVAEMGLAMLLAASRGLVAEHEAFRQGRERWLDDREDTDFTLFGQTIGFVGYGNIAREMHALLRPFSPRVFAHDPWLDQFPKDVTSAGLETLFETCRAVIIAAVPSEENAGLVSADLIGRMREGSVLVALSRAHVMDFEAALDAAQAGRIQFATDVYPSEPVDPTHRMRSAGNVILSPHRAAAVPGGRQAIGRFVLNDVRAILAGHPERALLVANKSRVEGMVRAQRAIEKAGRLANT